MVRRVPRLHLAAFFAVALVAVAPAHALNNCTTFSDLRGQSLVVVNTIGFRYSAACIRISTGTTVRIVSEFGSHPLYGGTVSGGNATIDPGSPIGPFVQGQQAEVQLQAVGEFPYFCDFHYGMGMMGSILVEPAGPLFADSFE